MTKRDYEKAVNIVLDHYSKDTKKSKEMVALAVQEAFVRLFLNDNPRFDVVRFRTACQTRL